MKSAGLYVYLFFLALVALYVGYGCHASIPGFNKMYADLGTPMSPLAKQFIAFHSSLAQAISIPAVLIVATIGASLSGMSRRLTIILSTLAVVVYGATLYGTIMYPMIVALGG